MSKQNINNIGNLLELAEVEEKKEVVPYQKPNTDVTEPTLSEKKEQEDLSTARDNILLNLDTTRDAISKLVQIVEESEDTRKFEVLNQFLKTNNEAAKNLVELHRILNKGSAEKHNNTIENAIFVGTTEDLNKIIKGQRSE